MRKVIIMIALVLALSLFWSFDSHAFGEKIQEVTGTLLEDEVTMDFVTTSTSVSEYFYNAGGEGRIYTGYPEEDYDYIYNGADSMYLKTTVSFEYNFATSSIGSSSFDKRYTFYLVTTPTLTLDTDCDVMAYAHRIGDVRIYYLVNGKKYDIPKKAYSYLYHGELHNRASLIVEADVYVYIDDVLNLDSHIDSTKVKIDCSSFGFRIKKSSTLTEYGLLNTIKTNLTTLASDLKKRYAELTANLTSWFDRQHDDMDTANTRLETANTKLQTLISSLQAYRILQHQDMKDLGDKLTNEYNDTSADKTSTDFNNKVTELGTVQDNVVGSATGNLDEYTLNSQGAMKISTQVAAAAPLVSAMMQSIFETTPAIGIIMSVTFSMILGCMLIGLFRYFKR